MDFKDADSAISVAITTARNENAKKLLFDLQRADLANYYSFIVRHAERGLEMGLDATFLVAFVGAREAADVLAFMERVVRNRGWNARQFFSMDEALKWLAESGPSPADSATQ